MSSTTPPWQPLQARQAAAAGSAAVVQRQRQQQQVTMAHRLRRAQQMPSRPTTMTQVSRQRGLLTSMW